jgi:hypothetical protein
MKEDLLLSQKILYYPREHNAKFLAFAVQDYTTSHKCQKKEI